MCPLGRCPGKLNGPSTAITPCGWWLIRATNANPPQEIAEAGLNAMLAFREFQLGVIADRRSKPPQDDLVSTLCYAEIDGNKLDIEFEKAGSKKVLDSFIEAA